LPNKNGGKMTNSTSSSNYYILISRHHNLYQALEREGIQALALNPGPSFTYLTGLHFHLSERPVVVLFDPNEPPRIVLPQFESAKLANLDYKIRPFPYSENPETWKVAFQAAMEDSGLTESHIGVEPRYLRVLELHLLESAAPRARFINAEECIATLRMYKSADEIDAMRKAVDIAQRALQATLPQIKIGRTERQIASELVIKLFEYGSEPKLPFFPIVSAGPNSANPHATPTDRLLQNGDLLVIDWGASYRGYYSDITRTFAVGEVESELTQIAKIVTEANAAGRNTAGPAIPAAKVDEAARGIITNYGYAQYFTHRTGHGLGLEGHEEPYIRDDNLLQLEPGMTFTIEPGIYLPERGGVRVEDDVVITSTGADCLTNLPRELIRVG
jgi:Xaa-Pro dipeptidase